MVEITVVTLSAADSPPPSFAVERLVFRFALARGFLLREDVVSSPLRRRFFVELRSPSVRFEAFDVVFFAFLVGDFFLADFPAEEPEVSGASLGPDEVDVE